MIDSLCTHCNSGINLYKIDTEKLTTENVSQNTKQVWLNNFKGLSDVQDLIRKNNKMSMEECVYILKSEKRAWVNGPEKNKTTDSGYSPSEPITAQALDE